MKTKIRELSTGQWVVLVQEKHRFSALPWKKQWFGIDKAGRRTWADPEHILRWCVVEDRVEAQNIESTFLTPPAKTLEEEIEELLK